MIPALALDPETNFQLLGDSGSGFRYSLKWNGNTHLGFMIPALDTDPSQIISLLAIQYPDLDPALSRIAKPH